MLYLTLMILIIKSCCLCIYATDTQTNDKIVVCYFRSWAIYRRTFAFNADMIDPFLCTHVVYMWARLSSSVEQIISNMPHIDLPENSGNALYMKTTELKQKNPKLKILLTVGGSIEPSENFSRLFRNPKKRARFASNAAKFIRDHNFDGLDVYWYQNNGNIEQEDKDAFPLLLKTLKEEFLKNNLLLTVILSGSKNIIDEAYDLPAIASQVDWINVNTYYYHSPNDNKFGIHAPLNSNDDNNVQSTINYYLAKQVPANKIVMRVSANGFGYKNINQPGNIKEVQGLFNEDKGFLTYFEICEYLESGYTSEWDSLSSTPLAVKNNIKISYDNDRSLEMKGNFARMNHLLGIAFSTLDVDDFSGTCSQNGTVRYPLLRALKTGLVPQDYGINITIAIEEY